MLVWETPLKATDAVPGAPLQGFADAWLMLPAKWIVSTSVLAKAPAGVASATRRPRAALQRSGVLRPASARAEMSRTRRRI
jgi:hypothetical protein